MKNKKSAKIGLVIEITLLFIITALTPIVLGYNHLTTGIETLGMHSACDDSYTCDVTFNDSELLTIFGETISNSLVEPEKGLLFHTMTDGPLDSPWPMESHDIRHTGRSPFSTADNPGDEIWRFWTGGWAKSSSAISFDGTIYFGSNDFYAVHPNGTLKWTYKTGIKIESCPAIDENGVIYIGDMYSSPNYLKAIYPNGTLKWKQKLGAIHSSPTIGTDGAIYLGSTNGNIYALYPNGTIKWNYKTNHNVHSSPAIGLDDVIYCGSHDKHLYAINPNGTLKWKFKTGDWIRGNPSIAEDGTIYFPSFDDHLYALYPNGTMKWKVKTGFGAAGSPAIGTDGTIYIGTNKLYAIYPNGTKKWSFNLGTDRYVADSSPAISSDGTIYIGVSFDGGYGGELIAVNSDGTERWRSGKICNYGYVSSSPAIAEDGAVYICSASTEEIQSGIVGSIGYLHAFNTFDPNAPDAPLIEGPPSGKAEKPYNYRFSSTDPNGDDVYYYIRWGDFGVENMIGPYESGEEVSINHTWEEKGTYIIKARAIDPDNHWGPWSELEVTIPKSKNMNYLEWLEKFPRINKELYDLNGNLKSYYLG